MTLDDYTDQIDVEPYESAARSINAIAWGSVEEVRQQMEWIDRETHGEYANGVESLTRSDDDYMTPILLYINLGGTYDTTLIYDVGKEIAYVGSWGDWVEGYEAENGDGAVR